MSGTIVTTNLDTGGTYINVSTLNGRNHKIVYNGDGTINIFGQNSGASRWYDTKGRLVLQDSICRPRPRRGVREHEHRLFGEPVSRTARRSKLSPSRSSAEPSDGRADPVEQD